jgi:LmbE family N-acetylglucosaminyl deacetylase
LINSLNLPAIAGENRPKRIIVFAPHQDDETLGCGGVIRKLINLGNAVLVVFLTDGSTSHARYLPSNELINLRRGEALNACEVLGVQDSFIQFLEFPDGQLC